VTCRPGKKSILSTEKVDPYSSRRLPPDEATRALAAATRISTVGLRPSFVIPAAAHSHPDCRAILILIVAPQISASFTAAVPFAMSVEISLRRSPAV
jgi:hypothetical protein